MPRVIGRTVEAQEKKSSAQSGPPATVDEIIEQIRAKSPREAVIAQRIVEWAKTRFTPRCTRTVIRLDLTHGPKGFHPLSIDNGGRIWTYNKNIRSSPPFDITQKWAEFRRRLNAIPNVDFPENEMYSSAKLATLASDNSLTAFLNVISWLTDQVMEAASNDHRQP